MKGEINQKKLVDFRKKQNLTQKEMAEKLGVSKITYSQKEQGLIAITVKDLINLKKNFKVNINPFLE